MKNFEGIVIKKVPVKARDIICTFLLRSGQVLSVYCYGGQGGGRYHKGSILELGHMLKVQVTPNKKYMKSEMSSSREWSLIWESSLIRTNILAFYFACFIFEITAKIATSHHIHEDLEMNHHEGLFNVVSNALFFLDKDIANNKNVDIDSHLIWFFVKLFGQLGISPDSSHCIHCQINLKNIGAIFEAQHGGFSCVNCLEQKGEYISQNMDLRQQIQVGSLAKKYLEEISALAYKEFASVSNQHKDVIGLLFNHLCYQFQMRPIDFKSKTTLF